MLLFGFCFSAFPIPRNETPPSTHEIRSVSLSSQSSQVISDTVDKPPPLLSGLITVSCLF